ncbi:hypothetical protein ACQ4LE_004504 [Meloidogyne hapla]
MLMSKSKLDTINKAFKQHPGRCGQRPAQSQSFCYNNIPETQLFLESASYKATIIQMASANFFEEKFATYNYGEITLVDFSTLINSS